MMITENSQVGCSPAWVECRIENAKRVPAATTKQVSGRRGDSSSRGLGYSRYKRPLFSL